MNDSTKPFLPWLIVVLLVVIFLLIIYMITSYLQTGYARQLQSVLYSLGAIPVFELFTFSILDSISRFGGTEATLAETARPLAISAGGLILMMVLAPWWLTRSAERSEQEGPQKRGVTWYAGAALILCGITVSAYQGVRFTMTATEIERGIEANRTVDELRNQLITLAYDAAELMLLPAELGGGEGSFLTLPGPDGEPRAIELGDLPSYGDIDRFRISIDGEITDHTLRLTGTPVTDSDDSPTHMEITITPLEENLFSVNRKS